jgi:3-hydroxyisobutyrate dehydrogenase-like beta-hydroxyacid dehydrogenase
MRIGFIGPGLMGSGMIRNLVEAGHELSIYARHPERASGLPAPLAPTIADAVSGRDIMVSCVTDSEDVRAVVQAVLAAPRPPAVLVECSTIAPQVARELAALCADRGVAYLDCPVSGGPQGAADGTLAVMVGGEERAVRTALPVLDAIGDPARRTHCGPVGAGLVAKLVNNMLVAAVTAATAEAIGVGQRAGLDPALVRTVLLGSTGASWQLEHRFPAILAGNLRPGFRARDLRKDLGHARTLAGGPLQIGDTVRAIFEDVPGDLDYGAVAREFMDLPEESGA